MIHSQKLEDFVNSSSEEERDIGQSPSKDLEILTYARPHKYQFLMIAPMQIDNYKSKFFILAIRDIPQTCKLVQGFGWEIIN